MKRARTNADGTRDLVRRLAAAQQPCVPGPVADCIQGFVGANDLCTGAELAALVERRLEREWGDFFRACLKPAAERGKTFVRLDGDEMGEHDITGRFDVLALEKVASRHGVLLEVQCSPPDSDTDVPGGVMSVSFEWGLVAPSAGLQDAVSSKWMAVWPRFEEKVLKPVAAQGLRVLETACVCVVKFFPRKDVLTMCSRDCEQLLAEDVWCTRRYLHEVARVARRSDVVAYVSVDVVEFPYVVVQTIIFRW
jgi:hypothetical protein